MPDPRAPNCRQFAVGTDGKVIGVELQILEQPAAPYALKSVILIDELTARGNTIACTTILAADGTPGWERVYLAWPWNGNAYLPEHALPGNPEQQHPIVNGYTPPALGPLAIYLGDAAGNPISDICGALGLPLNRHVGYHLVFRARGATPPPDPDDHAAVLAAIAYVSDQVARLAQHLGA